MLFLLNYILASININSETIDELISNISMGAPELIFHVSEALDAFSQVTAEVELKFSRGPFQLPYGSIKNLECLESAVTILGFLKEEVSASPGDISKQKKLINNLSNCLKNFESQESLDVILGMVDKNFKDKLKRVFEVIKV